MTDTQPNHQAAPGDGPSHLRFEGTLTAEDVKQHIVHQFAVPPHTGRLEVSLRFAPASVNGINNMLCLTLFDPDGCRGAGHRQGDRHDVRLSAGQATPGYRAGPLPAGVWTVEIDTHMVMPGEPCRYELEVALAPGGGSPPASTAPAPAGSAAPPAKQGPGWYRGDLHTHTVHSDAGWDVAALLAAARQHRLDFVTLTDHNTVSGLAEMDRAAGPDLLTMGGLELTTYWGHALCLGAREWIDWRVRPDGPGMAGIARQTYDRGQLFIIAHPFAVGDPYCTGCRWLFPSMLPGASRLIEVWNGPWSGDSHNEQALAQWYGWLNQGHRLVATAGSDAHGPQDLENGPGFSVVYAEALSEAAILRGLSAGHLYLSGGPRLNFTARADSGQAALMGDLLACETATLAVEWADCPPGARLQAVVDGRPFAEWPADGGGSRSWALAAGQARWCVVEVRGADGRMLALTNPIFLTGEGAEDDASG